MKLDRNNGRGKYAVINLRNLDAVVMGGAMPAGPAVTEPSPAQIGDAIATLERAGLINYGEPGSEHEFFVMMLKDRFAAGALIEYSTRACVLALQLKEPESSELDEYSDEIEKLADRAAASPWRKIPD